jgi:pyruvate/2-oxoacid:ferredoxin oxidoreductase beta subunit
MTSYRESLPSLRSVFDAAKAFGLTDDEAWRAVDETVWAVGADGTLDEYLDALAAALANGILDKQRRTLRFARRGFSEVR